MAQKLQEAKKKITEAERKLLLMKVGTIASSLALSVGILKEDIVTLGKCILSIALEDRYRREHLLRFDFTVMMTNNSLMLKIGTLEKQSYFLVPLV